MRKYVLILGLFLSLSACFADEACNIDVNYVVKDGYSDFTCKFANDTANLNTLADAEVKILGKQFEKDSLEDRLSRIETKIFGAIQGGSYLKRMNMINAYSNKCLIANTVSMGGFNTFGMNRRPYGHGFHHYGFRNPFNRMRYGTLTGFSPPVNYGYGYGYNMPQHYVVNNNNGIRRFFNPRYNNHYYNNPMYRPYLNGNYNTMQNARFIPLFNTNGQFGNGQMYNGYGFDGATNSNSGASVTIID